MHTCRHTIDLDIENCMFTLMDQLVKRIEVSPLIPREIFDTLSQCANNRDDVAKHVLRTSLAECKSLLTTVFNGGQWTGHFANHDFTDRVRSLGRYMRWIACSLSTAVFRERTMSRDCE